MVGEPLPWSNKYRRLQTEVDINSVDSFFFGHFGTSHVSFTFSVPIKEHIPPTIVM